MTVQLVQFVVHEVRCELKSADITDNIAHGGSIIIVTNRANAIAAEAAATSAAPIKIIIRSSSSTSRLLNAIATTLSLEKLHWDCTYKFIHKLFT